MNITAYFECDGTGATGLSPVVSVIDVTTDTIIITSQLMTELANAYGWYKYNFISFNPLLDYIITTDAATDSVDNRINTTSIGTTHISLATWETQLEAGYTAEELIRLISATLLGKAHGAGTGTMSFRSLADSTDRVVAQVDGTGNRVAVTLDAD